MWSYFLISLVTSVVLTLIAIKVAGRLRLFDVPDTERKRHRGAVPLLGGTAIFLAFWLTVIISLALTHWPEPHFDTGKLWGVFIGSAILIILGYLDDKKKMSPRLRILITAIAALCVVVGGVGIQKIANPFGGYIRLDQFGLDVYNLSVGLFVQGVIILVWLMATMYTTKLLDGLDGLTTGVTAIGALMIFFLTNTQKYYQPDVGLIALIFAGACLGFLIFNFHPAKIFLGEGGSLVTGFLLGVLAVISGGKFATALLVMAIPLLDVVRVVYVRAVHHQPIFKGDREHLHFRLLDAGLGHKMTVILYYFVAFIFGITTLFLQSKQKLIALVFLGILMLFLGVVLGRIRK